LAFCDILFDDEPVLRREDAQGFLRLPRFFQFGDLPV